MRAMRTLSWDGTDTDRIHISCFGGHRPYAFAEHRHHGFWELVCVRHGMLLHTVNGVSLRQAAGAFAIIRDGDAHALAGERVAYVNISFSTAIPAALRLLPRSAGDSLHRLDAPDPLVGVLPSAQRQAFLAACDRLAAGPSGSEACCRLVELILRLVRSAGRADDGQLPPWLSHLLPMMDGDADVPDLAALVRRSGVSHEHLARQMRRHLDLTPLGFLARARVNRAARLLATGDRSIGAIALACGFPDLASLSRTFARERGMSPSAWRRQEQRFIV